MNRIARRSGIIMLFALFLLSGFVFFVCEYVGQAGNWAIFPGSPHVYNNGKLSCGVVTDRNGAIIMDMNGGDRIYSSNLALRMSTLHWVGDRQGYISAPALGNYASQMVGHDLWNGVYNYAGQGGVTSLTLSAKVQLAALEALGSYKGTVAVYNYKTGEILCAVSTPNFDPDNLPDILGDITGTYEGAYMNRFTQSSYIPGSIFKVVTAAAALETVPDIMDRTFTCTGKHEIETEFVTCERAHGKQNLKAAFANSCNCAFAQIALELGGETMERYVAQFGVTSSVSFDGITTVNGNYEAAGASGIQVAWSAVGQYNDLVNPCSYLTFIGSVAMGGKGVTPHLVQQIRVGEKITYTAQPQQADRIMSASTAKYLQEFMRNNVAQKYGDDNFPGLTVCAKTGTAEVGGDKKPNAMFTGFVSDEEYPLAFIVCIEDGGYGKQVCVPIASKVLSACKEVLDQE